MKKIIKTISNVIASSLLLGSATEIVVSSQALGKSSPEVRTKKKDTEQTFNADKYETRHPLTPFTEGREEPTKGNELGRDGMGVVYDGTMAINNELQNVVIKEAISWESEPALWKEGEAGEKMLEAQEKTLMALEEISQNKDRDKRKDPLLSSIQGLENVVVPVMLKNGVLVQEKINGLNGYETIYGNNFPYSGGCVDDPQKAVERICGLVLALHSLHAAGIVHHDLKLENIMFERYTLPLEEIQAKISTQIQEFENQAKALEEEAKNLEGEARKSEEEKIQKAKEEVQELKEEVQELKKRAEELEKLKKLKKEKEKEGQKLEVEAKHEYECEYRIRLIDFGLANSETGGSYNGAPEIFLPEPLRTIIIPNWRQDVLKPSYDIYTLGTMLPSLLFGVPNNKSNEIIDSFNGEIRSSSPSQFLIYCMGKSMGKNLEDYIQKYPEYRKLVQQQEQLWQDRTEYKDRYEEKLRALKEEEEECKKKATDYEAKYQKLEKEINLNSRSEVLGIGKSINQYNKFINESKEFNKKQVQWEHKKYINRAGQLNRQQKQLDEDFKKYDKKFDEKYYELYRELNKLGVSLTQQYKNEILEAFKPKNEVDQHILEQFMTLNKAMKEATGRFYPEPVLTRLAKITADCLSIDPKLRPTAEKVLMELTDLALSDWGLENDSCKQEKALEALKDLKALKALETLKNLTLEGLQALETLDLEDLEDLKAEDLAILKALDLETPNLKAEDLAILKALKTLNNLTLQALEAPDLEDPEDRKAKDLAILKALETLTDLNLEDLEALKALDLEAEDLEVLKTLEALKTPTYKIENLYNRTQD
jgi:serine/threonine protein kinase